jgi:hypothetical protein
MSHTQRNIGFGGRIFLDEAEWLTYCRRKPVRYPKAEKATVCEVCGSQGSPESPLQNAHRIGFDLGVIELGLTPEFLDLSRNIVTACRRDCNKRSELGLKSSMELLRKWDIEDKWDIEELPKYLPAAIQEAWRDVCRQKEFEENHGRA